MLVGGMWYDIHSSHPQVQSWGRSWKIHTLQAAEQYLKVRFPLENGDKIILAKLSEALCAILEKRDSFTLTDVRAALMWLTTGYVESNRHNKCRHTLDLWTTCAAVVLAFDSRTGFCFNSFWAYDDVDKKVLCITLMGSTNNTTVHNVSGYCREGDVQMASPTTSVWSIDTLWLPENAECHKRHDKP